MRIIDLLDKKSINLNLKSTDKTSVINEDKTFYLGMNDRVFKEIFLKEENKDLLSALLYTSLKVSVNKMSLLNSERIEGNVSVRRKTLDVLLETDSELIGIEVNSSNQKYIRARNFAFFSDMISHHVGVGQVYDEVTQFIQINYTSGITKDPKECRVYKIQDDDRLLFIRNAFIYEINIDRIVKFWYDEHEEKIKKYKYIMMLGLPLEELEKLYAKTKDRMVKKFMEEVQKVNEDPRFREYMTKEQDQEKIQNTLIMEATEIGEQRGEKQKAIEIAKKMLEKYSVEEIKGLTGLNDQEIHTLSKHSLKNSIV